MKELALPESAIVAPMHHISIINSNVCMPRLTSYLLVSSPMPTLPFCRTYKDEAVLDRPDGEGACGGGEVAWNFGDDGTHHREFGVRRGGPDADVAGKICGAVFKYRSASVVEAEFVSSKRRLVPVPLPRPRACCMEWRFPLQHSLPYGLRRRLLVVPAEPMMKLPDVRTDGATEGGCRC